MHSREFASDLRRIREHSRTDSQGFAKHSRRIRKFADRVREDSRPVNVGSPSLICVGTWLGHPFGDGVTDSR